MLFDCLFVCSCKYLLLIGVVNNVEKIQTEKESFTVETSLGTGHVLASPAAHGGLFR